MASKNVGVHGTDEETGKVKSKPCPVTRKEFKDSAPDTITVTFVLNKREFDTGTMGYFAQHDETVDIAGKKVKVKGSMGLYIANSKGAK